MIGARSQRAGRLRAAHRSGLSLVIGPEATIGHMVMLHGCTIGRGALIGIGAIVLNGAKIGDDCLIGAGAADPEGKEIPSALRRARLAGQGRPRR